MRKRKTLSFLSVSKSVPVCTLVSKDFSVCLQTAWRHVILSCTKTSTDLSLVVLFVCRFWCLFCFAFVVYTSFSVAPTILYITGTLVCFDLLLRPNHTERVQFCFHLGKNFFHPDFRSIIFPPWKKEQSNTLQNAKHDTLHMCECECPVCEKAFAYFFNMQMCVSEESFQLCFRDESVPRFWDHRVQSTRSKSRREGKLPECQSSRLYPSLTDQRGRRRAGKRRNLFVSGQVIQTAFTGWEERRQLLQV